MLTCFPRHTRRARRMALRAALSTLRSRTTAQSRAPYALLVLLFLLPSVVVVARATPNVTLSASALPWLNPDPSARVGTLDLLSAAARATSAAAPPPGSPPGSGPTVALLPMTRGIARFAMNLIATLIAHTGGTSASPPPIVLLAFDPRSLARCEQFNLPCVDGRAHLPDASVGDGQYTFGSREQNAISFAKHRAALFLLRHNYSVLAMDADAVALSDAAAHFRQAVYLTGASAVFAEENSFSLEGQWPGREGQPNVVNGGWRAAPLLPPGTAAHHPPTYTHTYAPSAPHAGAS